MRLRKVAIKINNDTMEMLIAGARVFGLVIAWCGFLCVVAYIWHGNWRFLVTAALFETVAAALVWFGFLRYGNEEWFNIYDGARWSDLHCNVPVQRSTGRHEGPHQDGLRDPEGARTWS